MQTFSLPITDTLIIADTVKMILHSKSDIVKDFIVPIIGPLVAIIIPLIILYFNNKSHKATLDKSEKQLKSQLEHEEKMSKEKYKRDDIKSKFELYSNKSERLYKLVMSWTASYFDLINSFAEKHGIAITTPMSYEDYLKNDRKKAVEMSVEINMLCSFYFNIETRFKFQDKYNEIEQCMRDIEYYSNNIDEKTKRIFKLHELKDQFGELKTEFIQQIKLIGDNLEEYIINPKKFL